MSDNIAISVQGVSKAYRIWNSPRGRLLSPALTTIADFFPENTDTAKRLRAKASGYYRDFWAINDISFDVKKGESVGIIGRNGSGKSTLLQIIAGTLRPTKGSIQVNGRVAALLELGSGFNPDFTGIENVHLNAAILGLSRAEIESKLDSIKKFADIGDFIDQPVKTYSSGMMVRLAFAVQIQTAPEILIVDEALSVGDEPFQRKCFNEISILKKKGVSILFVSHSASSILEICSKAILIDKGEQLLVSHPKDAIRSYHQLCYAAPETHEEIRNSIISKGEETGAQKPEPALPASPDSFAYYAPEMTPKSRTEFSSRGAIIASAAILNQADQPVNILVKGDEYKLKWRVEFSETHKRVRFGWTVKTISGVVISGRATHTEGKGFEVIPKGSNLELTFNFKAIFNNGPYFIDVNARAEMEQIDTIIHSISDALMFKVQTAPSVHFNGYMDCSTTTPWTLNPQFHTEE